MWHPVSMSAYPQAVTDGAWSHLAVTTLTANDGPQVTSFSHVTPVILSLFTVTQANIYNYNLLYLQYHVLFL